MEMELFKNDKYALISYKNMWDFVDKIEEIKKEGYTLINFNTSSVVLNSKIVNIYHALLIK